MLLYKKNQLNKSVVLTTIVLLLLNLKDDIKQLLFKVYFMLIHKFGVSKNISVNIFMITNFIAM